MKCNADKINYYFKQKILDINFIRSVKRFHLLRKDNPNLCLYLIKILNFKLKFFFQKLKISLQPNLFYLYYFKINISP